MKTPPDKLQKVVDLSDDITTVFNSPCLLVGVHVQTSLSAHACPIEDDTTAVFTLPASVGGGSWLEGGDMRFETKMVVDPDNSGTGKITVVYIPNLEGLAGSGHNA